MASALASLLPATAHPSSARTSPLLPITGLCKIESTFLFMGLLMLLSRVQIASNADSSRRIECTIILHVTLAWQLNVACHAPIPVGVAGEVLT